jgi:preprotein translocase SecF subunit
VTNQTALNACACWSGSTVAFCRCRNVGEVTNAALIAVIVASLAVLGWIALAFRGVAGAFRYGVCAVIAMLHDILIMIGIMSIMGLLAGWEADALFLTGLLTVVGYSVQDTIVVFDRIRENAARHRGEPYAMIVNRSIMETIQRSLSLQLVVAFVLVSLFLMGGMSIHQLVGILLIGLLSGTYSSTFVAIRCCTGTVNCLSSTANAALRQGLIHLLRRISY